MSSRKKKTMTLPAFKLKWDDESILEEDDAIAENVRKLKHHQATLKKGAKGYKDIAEHLDDIKAIKGNDVNILTNSNNNATPPPKKSASRKKKSVSPNSPPAFRASRKKSAAAVSPNSNSPPKPKKGLVKLSGLASFFMGAPPPKVTLPPSPPRASASKAPPKASAAPPPRASASKAKPPPPPPRSPETVRRNAIEAARAYAHKRIPRHTRRRPGSNEAFIPAAPSGSSASPGSPEYDVEFPNILRAPHEPHEPITPAHCGRLDIAFIDDWIAGAVRALRIRGPPEDMPQRGRVSFRAIGVDQKFDHVDNSADGTCLIHAFLTATSAFYRNLSNDNKGILGRAFRRNIYARLWDPHARINIPAEDYRAVPKRLHLGRKMQILEKRNGSQYIGREHNVPRRRYIEYVGGVGEGRRHGYLYDTDVEKLAQCFNVNILLVPPEILNIRYYEDDSAAGRAKPNIILRQSGAHFTTLHLGEQFIFSREEILPIVEGVNAVRTANAAGMSVADRAKYAEGKRVFVVGHPEERIIQQYVWSNAGAPPGHAVRVSHVILESGAAAGQRVPVANIRFP